MRDFASCSPRAPTRGLSAAALAPHLLAAIDQRCEQFVQSSVADLCGDGAAFLALSEPLRGIVREHGAAALVLIARWRAEARSAPQRHPVIAQLGFHLRRFVKNNQQFLRLTAADGHAITRLYLAWLDDLVAMLPSAARQPLDAALPALLAHHRARLRAFTTGLGLVDSGPICREYAPAMQLALLGLHREMISGPLLDLGCGEQASLVRALQEEGVAACGLDAFAPPGVPGVTRGDWLTEPLGGGIWGTIVSHMAFSHHFLHQHLTASPAAGAYARRYMEILAALAPGGSFYYTPGLPFIEALLPRAQYRVERQALGGLRGTLSDQELSARVGESTFYGVRVQRLP